MKEETRGKNIKNQSTFPSQIHFLRETSCSGHSCSEEWVAHGSVTGIKLTKLKETIFTERLRLKWPDIMDWEIDLLALDQHFVSSIAFSHYILLPDNTREKVLYFSIKGVEKSVPSSSQQQGHC